MLNEEHVSALKAIVVGMVQDTLYFCLADPETLEVNIIEGTNILSGLIEIKYQLGNNIYTYVRHFLVAVIDRMIRDDSVDIWVREWKESIKDDIRETIKNHLKPRDKLVYQTLNENSLVEMKLKELKKELAIPINGDNTVSVKKGDKIYPIKGVQLYNNMLVIVIE